MCRLVRCVLDQVMILIFLLSGLLCFVFIYFISKIRSSLIFFRQKNARMSFFFFCCGRMNDLGRQWLALEMSRRCSVEEYKD